MTPIAYRLAAKLVHRVPWNMGKLSQSLDGRRAASGRWTAWSVQHSTANRRVWVHAASVGEALTAMPVTHRLAAAHPSLEVVLSHSSPSVTPWRGTLGAAHVDYIPLDEPTHVARVLDEVRPALIVFARGDLWPAFVAQATARQIPLAVIGGTVRPRSRRLMTPLRQLFRPMYVHVAWLGAVSSDDAARWMQLGVPRDRTDVTGDPRHDQILERALDMDVVASFSHWTEQGTVLVAGSTHETDERALLDACQFVLRSNPDARLVIVPHEPTGDTIARLLSQAGARAISAQTWEAGTGPRPDTRCVVVERMGILSHLYALADVAYVGGGFGRSGVHAVAEPAVHAVPIMIGPHYQSSADARAMVQSGGAVALGASQRSDREMADVWQLWSADPSERARAGHKARTALTVGAADASARALGDLLSRRRGQTST